MSKEIRQKELENMAKFFLKELFGNIPMIPCYISDDEDLRYEEGGRFLLKRNDDYDRASDDLCGSDMYRVEHINILDNTGFFLCDSESWEDPINHPELSILISDALVRKEREFFGTLLHELTHYYCWHIGYDYMDGSYDFEKELKRLGLPSNYDIKFSDEDGRWHDSFDYTKLDNYIKSYKEKTILEKPFSSTTQIST